MRMSIDNGHKQRTMTEWRTIYTEPQTLIAHPNIEITQLLIGIQRIRDAIEGERISKANRNKRYYEKLKEIRRLKELYATARQLP